MIKEIEKKFLIKEKRKNYPCPLEIKKLMKEIKKHGEKISQLYLPLKQ